MATSTFTNVDRPRTSQTLASRRPDERGANLIEYALLVALIALVCVAGVTALGQKTKPAFSSVSVSI